MYLCQFVSLYDLGDSFEYFQFDSNYNSYTFTSNCLPVCFEIFFKIKDFISSFVIWDSSRDRLVYQFNK